MGGYVAFNDEMRMPKSSANVTSRTAREPTARNYLPLSRIGSGLEGLGLEFSVLLEEYFDFAFGVLQLLAAVVGERDAFFKKFQCLLEWDLSLLELIDDFLQTLKALFELRQSHPSSMKRFYCKTRVPAAISRAAAVNGLIELMPCFPQAQKM
jgi:hypothetical protein